MPIQSSNKSSSIKSSSNLVLDPFETNSIVLISYKSFKNLSLNPR